MKTPDHHTSKLGSKDFVFQVNKWPFSITCNPLLPTITETFIDLALVKDMKITMKKVECRNISYGGLSTKLVGSISQTVQVVHDGVPSGTMHLKAKVIRNLTNLYEVDCIASQKLYKILACDNAAAALNNLNDSVATSESSVELAASDADELKNDVDARSDISANDLIFNNDDSPKTRMKKRRNRFMIGNISFSSSMISSPPMSPRSSSPAAEASQVPSSHANLTSSSPGRPPNGQTSRESPPPPSQNPPQHLTDFILRGHIAPCSCVETLRAQQQLQLLPPHYPVYLPAEHQPCGPVCATHRVHGDNLHPPDPSLCTCDPPRLQLQPGHVRDAPPPEASPKTGMMSDINTNYVQSVATSGLICADCESPTCPGNCPESQVYQHISSVGHLHQGGGHDDVPPLPPGFLPCGNYCGYRICQCLRSYEGRDWAS